MQNILQIPNTFNRSRETLLFVPKSGTIFMFQTRLSELSQVKFKIGNGISGKDRGILYSKLYMNSNVNNRLQLFNARY